MRTFLVEPVVVVLVHGPRHAEVGELDGARRVDEAVPAMGGFVKNLYMLSNVLSTHMQK